MVGIEITYEVRIENPSDHRAQFTIRLSGVAQPTVDLVLPSWIPGSYHIVDTARNVRRFEAKDRPGGSELPVTRLEKARWQVRTNGAPAVHITYEVYGYRMETDAVDITPEHLFLNAVACFPYVDGHRDAPAEVVLHIPDQWQVVTELTEIARHPPRFRAADYDELVDQPIDCGTPVIFTIHPLGIPHRIVFCGQGGNYEPHRLQEDLTRMVEAIGRMLGELPFPRYTIFEHLNDVPDGALEHRNTFSHVIVRSMFRPDRSYRRFLLTAAHEYFHAYNVKRIRPKAFIPFDYTRETYTKLLWAMEGTTDYFAGLILLRSGLLRVPKFLEGHADAIRGYLEIPGRRGMSLEESSVLTWIELYQPYEETPNQSVSYYLKGDLVSMVLDLEIRSRTENRASLESAWRDLWIQYGRPDRGIEEDELLPALERSTGIDLHPFFRSYVSGTEELDFDRTAQLAGLTFRPKAKPPESDDEGEAGYLGFRYNDLDHRVRVTHVLQDGPARRAGLSPRDEIVAIDRERITHENFPNLLKRYPPGTAAELTVFRRGWLTTVPVTFGKNPPEKYEFLPLANVTPLQRSVYAAWTGAAWEPPKPVATETAAP